MSIAAVLRALHRGVRPGSVATRAVMTLLASPTGMQILALKHLDVETLL